MSPSFLQQGGGWKIVGKKGGGACTFQIFRGGISKKGGVDFFRGGWGFSESNFQLLMKYQIIIIMCLASSLQMSPTWKLKTSHQYKALISFKFANKDSIIRKTAWKFPMHYVNTTFNILGNSLIKKGKYLVIESSYFCVE